MSDYLPTTVDSAEQSLKNLWKRPGGLFAKITGWGAIAALGYGLFKILPFLVAGAANLLVLILELVAIVAILYVVTSKEFRRGLQLSWLQIMRKFYGFIVNIDPINILQNGIKEMKKKLLIVHENVTKLESLLVDMKRKLSEYKDEFERNVSKRGALEKKLSDPRISSQEALKYKASLQLVNNEIARGGTQIKAQNERIATSEKYLGVMKNLEIAADFKVKDAENELKYRKNEYEQAKAQQKDMGSITSILKGGLTKSMEEELAMEQVTNTINSSIAEMNRLLDGSNDILVNFELDNDANADKADKILEMFENGGFDIFNAETEKAQNDVKRLEGNTVYMNPGEPEPVYIERNAVSKKPKATPKYF